MQVAPCRANTYARTVACQYAPRVRRLTAHPSGVGSAQKVPWSCCDGACSARACSSASAVPVVACASTWGAVQACAVRCTHTVRGVASARTARPPRQLRRRARWRLWRARGFCTAKEFCAAAAGRGDPYRTLGHSLPWPGDPYPNPNRRGRFQRGRPGSGGAHGRCLRRSRAACARRPLYVLRCEPDSGNRLEKSKDHDNTKGYALV